MLKIVSHSPRRHRTNLQILGLATIACTIVLLGCPSLFVGKANAQQSSEASPTAAPDTLVPQATHASPNLRRRALVFSVSGDAALSRVANTASSLRSEMERQGLPVLTENRTVQLLDEHVVREAGQPRSTEVAASNLETCTAAAMSQVATFDGEGEAPGDACLAAALPQIATLNLDELSAERLLDSCLLVHRALRDAGDEQALAQLFACRVYVPDLEPDPRSHPPEVLSALARVDAAIAAGGARVSFAGQAGCSVHLNGRAMGSMPTQTLRLSPGRYAVELRCENGDSTGIRRFLFEENGTYNVFLDAPLERTLNPDRLAFVRQADASNEEFARALTSFAARFGAEELWLVTATPSTSDELSVNITRFDVVNGLRMGSRTIELQPRTMGVPIERLARVVGELAGIDRGEPVSTTRPTTENNQAIDLRMDGNSIAPSSYNQVDHNEGLRIATALSGSFLFGIGWGLYGYQASLEDRAASTNSSEERRSLLRTRDDMSVWSMSIGGVASLGLTLLSPILLTPEDGIPWWSLAMGAVGIASASVGIYELSVGSRCLRSDAFGCLAERNLTTEAVLWFETALPLLTVPVTFLVRQATGPVSQSSRTAAMLLQGLRVQSEMGGASLHLSGSF